MKKWVLGLIIVVISALLLFYWGRVEILNRFTSDYPVQLITYFTINNPKPDRQWKIMQMQPMVVGYASYDERNYLLIVYPENGGLQRGIVLLNGKIAESNLEKIVYAPESGETTKITFDELKKKISLGQRIRIDYLNDYPDDWMDEDKDFCTLVTPVCEYPVVQNQSKEILAKSWIFQPRQLFVALSLSKSLLALDSEVKK